MAVIESGIFWSLFCRAPVEGSSSEAAGKGTI
jgi:hypothetical protein